MRRLPLFPTLLVTAAVATMIALGLWQLQRAEWKERLLDHYASADASAPPVAWPRDERQVEESLFRRSGFTCEQVLAMRATAATSATGGKGVAQIARCAIDGGGEAEVALGWSLPTQPFKWTGGPVTGMIAPGGRLMVDRPVPPLQQLAPPDPGDLPNNHLAYAGQWFFFALTALGIYIVALRRKLRGEG